MEGNIVRVGITDFAQNSLGDIVFVSVHGVDSTVESGDTFGEVESTKSVSDLYAPIPGSVVTRNEALDDNPDLVNTDPYGAGWIAEIEVANLSVLDSLLDAEAYRQATAE
jgi:glycine cleavage system H protein